MSKHKRYAMATVVEAEDANKAWEEMGQMVSATFDNFDFYFLGDPFDIPTQDTYDSGQAAHAILRGVSKLRAGLPVADDAGDMSTSDGLGADPRRDEDNQAALDAAPFSDHFPGHPKECRGFPAGGGKPARRDLERCAVCREESRLVERVDWLEREGWELQAMDYARGEVTLPELLRRLNDEPDVVHQIATWLEEDAAEDTPLEVPEGCTGAVMFDRNGDPSIQHDLKTCPVHEEDAPILDLGGPVRGRYWKVTSGHDPDDRDVYAAAAYARVTGSVGASYNGAKVERV